MPLTIIGPPTQIGSGGGGGSVDSVTAGAGMTDSGTATDPVLNVIAADASIVVAANSVGVGVLQSDAMHGARGGGTQHANVVASGAAGFMTGADKALLDGLVATGADITAVTAGAGLTGGGASGAVTLDVVANADASIVVNANDVQVGILATDAQHGVRGGGTQHANAVSAGAAGFMTGADKALLDSLVAYNRLRATVTIADDFVTSVATGELGWTTTVSGTGAAAAGTAQNISQDHIGIVRLETGTTTTGRACIAMQGGSIQLGGGQAEVEAIAILPTLSDGTDTYTARLGLGDQPAAGENVDGVFFRYNSGVNSGRWEAVCIQNSTETAADTGVAAAAATWVRFNAIANSAGTSVAFYIDGTLVATITTNIPITSARLTGPNIKIEKSAGTTNRDLQVDWYRFTKATAR